MRSPFAAIFAWSCSASFCFCASSSCGRGRGRGGLGDDRDGDGGEEERGQDGAAKTPTPGACEHGESGYRPGPGVVGIGRPIGPE